MRLTFRQTHLYRFVNMAQWEGFEPYESRKRRVLTYPQVL